MSDSLHPIRGGAPIPADESPGAAFDALVNRRRREVLAVLADRRGPVPEADLVSHVVAREAGKPLQAVGDESSTGVRTETGVTGEGADNPLVAVVERLFDRQRDGPTGTGFDGGPR